MQQNNRGWVSAGIGVAIFAGSLPATRVAVADLDPMFLTAARAVVAAVLGLAVLVLSRQPRPLPADLPALGLTGVGVVLGFPLLTALALRYVTAAHAIVFLGLLPLCTAIFAVLRGGERLRPAFWAFSAMGAACVVGYAAADGFQASLRGDLAMLGAIVVCGMGYTEGARLSRRLGGWQAISWALVLSLPVMAPFAWLTLPASFEGVRPQAWLGFAYVSVFSMLVGFVFWYRGLARGGIAAVGQLQLLQPLLALGLAAWLLHETVSVSMLAAALATTACVAGARRFAR